MCWKGPTDALNKLFDPTDMKKRDRETERQRQTEIMNWVTFNYACVYVYIYICNVQHSSVSVHWERFQENQKDVNTVWCYCCFAYSHSLSLSLYIYIYIERERERERDRDRDRDRETETERETEREGKYFRFSQPPFCLLLFKLCRWWRVNQTITTAYVTRRILFPSWYYDHCGWVGVKYQEISNNVGQYWFTKLISSVCLFVVHIVTPNWYLIVI